MLQTPNDSELVEQACLGDVHSFRILFERHNASAVAIARSHVRDSHLAEDAAQEAFAIACRTLVTLENGNRFVEWLGTICRRTAIKIARQQKKETRAVEQKAALSYSTPEGLDHTALTAAIAHLPASLREVIELRYFASLGHEQIAIVLGTTTAAVHGRLQRARRKLEKLLTNVLSGE